MTYLRFAEARCLPLLCQRCKVLSLLQLRLGSELALLLRSRGPLHRGTLLLGNRVITGKLRLRLLTERLQGLPTDGLLRLLTDGLLRFLTDRLLTERFFGLLTERFLRPLTDGLLRLLTEGLLRFLTDRFLGERFPRLLTEGLLGLRAVGSPDLLVELLRRQRLGKALSGGQTQLLRGHPAGHRAPAAEILPLAVTQSRPSEGLKHKTFMACGNSAADRYPLESLFEVPQPIYPRNICYKRSDAVMIRHVECKKSKRLLLAFASLFKFEITIA